MTKSPQDDVPLLPWRPFAAGFGLFVMAAAGIWLWGVGEPAQTLFAWAAYLTGTAITVISIDPAPPRAETAAQPDRERVSRPLLIAGAAGIIIALVLTGWPALIVFVAALIIVVRAFPARRVKARKSNILAAALLLLLGFGLRTHDLDSAPGIVSTDEAAIALDSMDLSADPFSGGTFSMPNLGLYVESAFAAHDNAFLIRFPSALWGTLGLAAAYALGRALFGPRAGLTALAFLMGHHLHLHFSRVALFNITDAVWITLALAAFMRGLRRRDRRQMAMAGAFAGLGQYFYFGGRLILPVLGALTLCAWRWERRTLSRRERARLIAPVFIALVLALVPQAIRTAQGHYDPAARFLQESWIDDGAPADLGAQLLDSYLAYWQVRDTSAFYFTRLPAAGIGGGILLAVGIGLFLRRRGRSAWALGIWIGLLPLLAGFPLHTPPQYQRYAGLAPALAVIAGAALVELARTISPRRAFTFAVIGALALTAVDVNHYFNAYVPSARYGTNFTSTRYTRAADVLARRIAAIDKDTREGLTVIFISRGFWNPVTYRVIAWRSPDLAMRDAPTPGDLDEIAPPALFVMLPDQTGDLAIIRSDYPSGYVEKLPLGDTAQAASLLYWWGVDGE